MFIGIIFELGSCLFTGFDEDGFLLAQADALGYSPQESAHELHHWYGFISRPLDPGVDPSGEPIQGQSCNMLFGLDGNEGHAWVAGDPRIVVKLPPTPKGGSAQYGSDGGFAQFNPNTHTWTLYQPYEFDGEGTPTKAHLVTVGKDGNGKPIVELASGEGPAVTVLEDKITISNGGGSWIEVTSEGVNVVGQFKAAGGADLGGPTSVPLAKFAELVAWSSANQAAIVAIGSALTALGNSSAAAAVTAAGTAQSALSGNGATILTKGA